MNKQDQDNFDKWWHSTGFPNAKPSETWQAALEDERNRLTPIMKGLADVNEALSMELYKKQEKIKALIKALEFYADENNWQSIQVGYGSRSQIKHYDLFDTSTDDTQRLVGGFKAREILKEYKEHGNENPPRI